MPEDFFHTNRRPLDQIRQSDFNSPHKLSNEQLKEWGQEEGCWYAFLFDKEEWPEFLRKVYDICDQHMFYIESTPCWPSHPDIVIEFLSIIKSYQAFQKGGIFEKEPNYGLDFCEKMDKSFERIKEKLSRCSSECSYTRQRRLDEELSDRYANVRSLSGFIVPGIFERPPGLSNQTPQNESDTTQKGDVQ
jgi:hypothetical protein